MSTLNSSAKFGLKIYSKSSADLYIDGGFIDSVEAMSAATINPGVRCPCDVFASENYVAIVQLDLSSGRYTSAEVWHRSEYPGEVIY